MRGALIFVCALLLDATLLERAWAAQACAWIVESVEDDGTHMFRLNLRADAPTSVSVRFHGSNFTSGAMGGDLIQLEAGEPKEVDNIGFDVDPDEDLRFDAQLFDHAMATLDEVRNPSGKPLATFDFRRKVGADERAPPADLAAEQCRPLG